MLTAPIMMYDSPTKSYRLDLNTKALIQNRPIITHLLLSVAWHRADVNVWKVNEHSLTYEYFIGFFFHLEWCHLISGNILQIINSLAPGRSKCDFKNVIFNLALLIAIFKSSYNNVLRWMPQDLTDVKSALVQVMAWCRQATSHFLNQCWPRSATPYSVTRPHWVNSHQNFVKSFLTF